MSDQPKLLRDMTDAEIGALLKARLMREKMQVFVDGDWRAFPNLNRAQFQLDYAYRVKPKSERETITIHGASAYGWCFEPHNADNDTHRITFDSIDGQPDCASIRMERIK